MKYDDKTHTYLTVKTPGLRCQKCGKDISHRVSTTKYCHECSREAANERNRQEKEYIMELKKRDAVKSPKQNQCVVCNKLARQYDNFCSRCGQRLK